MSEQPRAVGPAEVAPRRWRAVIAALANESARRVYAELILGVESTTLASLSPSRRRQITKVLTQSGLVSEKDGRLVAGNAVFADLLASAPPTPKPAGLDRFFDEQGRIAVYPSNATIRGELLAAIAPSILKPGEVLSEQRINARLSDVTHDVAVLRRHLVDHGLIERTPSGTAYSLVAPESAETDVPRVHNSSISPTDVPGTDFSTPRGRDLEEL
ncbi:MULTISPECIES: DUF2087 domain-containing protein [Microbacterium]|uniref:DUF2087 domain-containing protein n=1 Tax=Microbacterium TaxID=33882 RepID=UPI000E960C26|nr:MULTISPECIES: DUF2087 domain-containing protein [Microbacterium]HAS31170.1 hypothetical protein [Microbacterium sp.]HBS75761.1 hypothetical protein [Microbacterium sp.]|tara:strand:- start:2854 stop:3498 length:645 start_codon:yes stop_codon:yes gene_type:complete